MGVGCVSSASSSSSPFLSFPFLLFLLPFILFYFVLAFAASFSFAVDDVKVYGTVD